MGSGNCSGNKHRSIGLLALRIAVGFVFIVAGWGKLKGIDGFAGMLEDGGFPLPMMFAYLVAIIEFLGGLGILLGVFTRVWAKLLSFVMLVALLVVHTKMPLADAFTPILALGGTVALAMLGGGGWVAMKKDCTCKMCGGGNGCCGGGK